MRIRKSLLLLSNHKHKVDDQVLKFSHSSQDMTGLTMRLRRALTFDYETKRMEMQKREGCAISPAAEHIHSGVSAYLPTQELLSGCRVYLV